MSTQPARFADGVGNRWWWLRISRFDVKLRLWAFEVIIERGSIRRNADWGFDGLSIDLPSILLTVVDPRRLATWERS